MSFVGRCMRLASFPPPQPRRQFMAAALLFPLSALGQETPAAAESQAAVLEEIVVTARKVEEDLYHLPLSVSAISGEFVDATDLSSLFEAQFNLPGLVVSTVGMFGGILGLRGVGIAPHIDGIYLGSSSLMLSRMFDVERVEVVKGPQGALYGRNATGGSMNIISRAPRDEFSAAVESAIGSFDTIRVQGHINIPAEKVSFRLAVAGADGDGFIRNTADDRKFAAEDYAGARASLHIRPSENLAIDVKALHVEDDGASNDLWLPPKDFLADPADYQLTTVTLANPYLSMTNDLVDVDLTYDLDRIQIRSITGYARNVTRALDDCAGLPNLRGCVRGVDPERYEQRSQEFHVRSLSLEPFEWMVGAFMLDSNTSTHFHLKLLQPYPINDYVAVSDEAAYALFGQATRSLGERWGLTGSARLSDERQRLTSSGRGIGDSPTPTTAAGSWGNTSWRIGLQYAPSDYALVYANVGTGFKSGGISQERLPNGELNQFDPEELVAYEVGINLRRPDRRWSLLASAFRYDYRDLQVRTFAIFNDEPKLITDNAADAEVYGIDLSAAIDLTERLSLSTSAVWLPKRDFVEFTSAVTGDSLTGNKLSHAPEESASISLSYAWPLRNTGSFLTSVAYSYRSSFFFTRENDPGWAQDEYGLLDLFLRWDSGTDRWYAFASGRNLSDTNYFNQAYLQSSPGYPANYEIGFGWRF